MIFLVQIFCICFIYCRTKVRLAVKDAVPMACRDFISTISVAIENKKGPFLKTCMTISILKKLRSVSSSSFYEFCVHDKCI